MTQAVRESTTVTIVGGGVSGLTTALLLRSRGVDCVVLERRARSYVEEMHGASGSPVSGGGSFRMRIMRARLERLLSSETAARYYAEMFTGLG